MRNHHRRACMALLDMLHQRLVQAGKPMTMAELQALARQNGFTGGDARGALHKLAEMGRIVYVSDPTAIAVMAVEVGE